MNCSNYLFSLVSRANFLALLSEVESKCVAFEIGSRDWWLNVIRILDLWYEVVSFWSYDVTALCCSFLVVEWLLSQLLPSIEKSFGDHKKKKKKKNRSCRDCIYKCFFFYSNYVDIKVSTRPKTIRPAAGLDSELDICTIRPGPSRITGPFGPGLFLYMTLGRFLLWFRLGNCLT